MRAIGLKSFVLIGCVVIPLLFFISRLSTIYNALLQNKETFDLRTIALEKQIVGVFNRSVIRPTKNETLNSIYVSWMPFIESKATATDVAQRGDITVKHTVCRRKYWLIILIASGATNFVQRMDIRLTWGKNHDTFVSKTIFRIFFLISKTENADDSSLIEAEMERFGDIIFRDSYDGDMWFTPSFQTGLKWSLKNCNYDYIMITKDNVYINLKSLIEQLKQEEQKSVYLGHVFFEIAVKRQGEYALSIGEYPKPMFSRYCSSAGFVLSLNVAIKMAGKFRQVTAFRITDAYVGELALLTGIDVIHNDRFSVFENPYKCAFKANAILLHPIKQGCMKILHEQYLLQGSTTVETNILNLTWIRGLVVHGLPENSSWKMVVCWYVVPLTMLWTIVLYAVYSHMASLAPPYADIEMRLRRIDYYYKEVVKLQSLKIKYRSPPNRVLPWKAIQPDRSVHNKDDTLKKYHSMKILRKPTCKGDYDVIVMIQSRISNFDRRMLIRNTWGGYCKRKRCKTFFIVAKSKFENDLFLLDKEYDVFRDIIIGDTEDNFYSLIFKLQMAFLWSIHECTYKYMLKCDDDIFVNIDNLFAFLNRTETPRESLFAGYVQYAAKIQNEGKYSVPIEEQRRYNKMVYPRYCSGGGYVLSFDVVEKMCRHLDEVGFMSIDDAYVGELALKSGVDTLHDARFDMYVEKCEYKPDLIVHHPVKTRVCMESIYEGFKNISISEKSK